jgi:predicted nucleic acid-binding protein
MLAPSLVVVDTSAAIELLVADAPSRREYVALFAHLRASDCEIAYSELLEVELLEAAFTWDVRRERRLDWRKARRDGTLQRTRRLEQTILRDWDAFLGGVPAHRYGTHSFLDDAARVMDVTGLGSNDAVHLALARSLEVPIVTHDRPMIRAADAWPGALSVRSQ